MRKSPMPSMSKACRAEFAEAGIAYPMSTFKPKPKASLPTKAKRQADTGPSRSVRDLLAVRSGGMCEWPACPERATDCQHRLSRKAGGRHREMRERLNRIEWLLHACRPHHAYVTSPVGLRRCRAIAMGWLLTERQDAAQVPVLTRHHPEPVWLTPTGGWATYEEACA